MIDRRTLLRTLAATPLVGLLGQPRAGAVTAESWKQAFDAALARDPRLLGWKGVTEKRLATAAPEITGKLPGELRGTFYRNGPARHERAGHRYQHWFDGDGMVQAFRFDGGSVSHHGRMVETAPGRVVQASAALVWAQSRAMTPNTGLPIHLTTASALSQRSMCLCRALVRRAKPMAG